MTREDFYKAERLKREIKTHQDNIKHLSEWDTVNGIRLGSDYVKDIGWLKYTKDDVEKIIELEKEIIKSMEEEFERL